MSKVKPKQLLSRGKILVPVLLTLGITFWLLYDASNTVHFQEVEHGGTHLWVDGNQNNVLDNHLAEDFRPSPKGDFKQVSIWDVLRTLPSGKALIYPLVLAFLFMVGRDFFYMLRLRFITHKRLSWRQCIRSILLWEFASALSPGTVGGTAVAMFILEREGLKLGTSTALVVLTALLDNLFYLLFVPIIVYLAQAALSDANTVILPEQFVAPFWLAYGLIAAVFLALVIGLFVFPSAPEKLLNRVFSWKILRRWKEWGQQLGKDLSLASRTLSKEKPRYFLKAFWTTMGSWVSRFLVINALFAVFFKLTTSQHLILLCKQFVLWLLMLVSPTPGASGVAELGFQQLLEIDYAAPIAIACLAILWRCYSYFPYLIIGAIILPRWLQKTSKRKAV